MALKTREENVTGPGEDHRLTPEYRRNIYGFILLYLTRPWHWIIMDNNDGYPTSSTAQGCGGSFTIGNL